MPFRKFEKRDFGGSGDRKLFYYILWDVYVTWCDSSSFFSSSSYKVVSPDV
mgnify:FL=1